MITARSLAFTGALLLAVASTATAQSAAPPGRVELSGGVTWFGESNLGAVDANLTTANSGTLRFFSTSSTLGGGSGLEGRVGVRVWRSLEG